MSPPGYAVFANGGYRVAPYFIDRIEDAAGKVVWRADAAHGVHAVRSSRAARPDPRPAQQRARLRSGANASRGASAPSESRTGSRRRCRPPRLRRG